MSTRDEIVGEERLRDWTKLTPEFVALYEKAVDDLVPATEDHEYGNIFQRVGDHLHTCVAGGNSELRKALEEIAGPGNRMTTMTKSLGSGWRAAQRIAFDALALNTEPSDD